MNRAAILGACVLLAGCAGGSEDDLQAWMNEQAKTMRGAVRALPELKPFPVVAYAGTAQLPAGTTPPTQRATRIGGRSRSCKSAPSAPPLRGFFASLARS